MRRCVAQRKSENVGLSFARSKNYLLLIVPSYFHIYYRQSLKEMSIIIVTSLFGSHLLNSWALKLVRASYQRAARCRSPAVMEARRIL
ncbi:uncharacterized protein B0J16DRAFT_97663 [Fusarium flagelliforme]|uniref:uncharacterized protein n=1 Tax=Fusarium flagelliforme TaxID=2675880 RepID=UPI001E8EF325|nr:uncharacterized protein B0J16DRAFT_97663 [Fusarium flagelliforme]KAH7188609.1 hypothetical protein B0J16DRAFT_97663 [Fusarium flagelliforme]